MSRIIAVLRWVCRIIAAFIWIFIIGAMLYDTRLTVEWYVLVVANIVWASFEIHRWKVRHPAISARRKQLIVLLVVAAWVSLMFLRGHNVSNDFDPYRTPDKEMSAAFFSSLPVVLFGGVLFWWFGAKE